MSSIIRVRDGRKVTVKCAACGRSMTVKWDEEPPYYCYRCEDEAAK
ncbi:MAG: hypothetical protein ACYTEQ_01495 [Planctomycetota bacterium]